jgi:exodeoxyribonuclease III
MKIATWNVNSIKPRLEHVLTWLDTQSTDVLVLQEIKTVCEKFPLMEFEGSGYHIITNGQKTYNGVAILSKSEPSNIQTSLSDFDDPQRRVLFADIDGVRVMDVYVPNGSEVGSDKYEYKLAWLDALTRDVETAMAEQKHVVLLGDFNIAPADLDVYDPDKWQDRILCSDAERDALTRLLDLGLHDVFRELSPDTQQFSWWDYRQAAFRRNMGLRIDLILASKLLMNSAKSCTIDTEPRGWERPSDHAPVVATFE